MFALSRKVVQYIRTKFFTKPSKTSKSPIDTIDRMLLDSAHREAVLKQMEALKVLWLLGGNSKKIGKPSVVGNCEVIELEDGKSAVRFNTGVWVGRI